MKSYLFCILIIVLACNNLKAQQVISSSGDSYNNSSGSISYTIGEPIIETYKASDIIITQGFNQTYLTITSIDEFIGIDYKISAYPNPTEEFVILTISKEDIEGLQYLLYSLDGSLLMQKQIQEFETYIPFDKMSTGDYILKINIDNTVIKSFKIVKTQ